jgi:hypothetical protein
MFLDLSAFANNHKQHSGDTDDDAGNDIQRQRFGENQGTD